MDSEHPANTPGSRARDTGVIRTDLSNIHVREDLARAGRCANVHLATGRTCLLPVRHYGPCEFHNPQEAEDFLRG